MDKQQHYWHEHALMKDAHLANCVVVHDSFQQYLTQYSRAASDEKCRKLQYLLTNVDFCCQVLSESPATHRPRPQADIQRVVKAIRKVVTPYMAKLEWECQTRATLPSLSELFGRDGLQRHVRLNHLWADVPTKANAYWSEVERLRDAYLDQVVGAKQFFERYVEYYDGQQPQNDPQEVVSLCDYADYCAQVLQERRCTHPPRSTAELECIVSYITTIIVPHLTNILAQVPFDMVVSL
ncbi:Aste57867_24364 [Aphanomyces stellatus]|uniref:Aste57867_24364 protein n=1 Tax=Aphanomyces stellatus TaxID=120398 RepID=A0A485LQ55_9STRA|nr:hypothetical protein As57867_024288 [Aphanomyces stellatus]VFU01004.1 Aste57867_24364 [Aphanomyces stellatus]